MANVNNALAVLADPVRKTLVEALRAGPLTVGELAAHVTVSRSAVSQHLQVLKAAELVEDEADGTRRRYSLQAGTLGELRAYVDALWGDALANFAGQIDAPVPARKKRKRP
ncbi:MAG TPA: metalloregulator ArsR/SmtB family transcription factor [Burkholderiaceae bacterium]|jgi:DNA-binding transcriptional ArsR family regulator|nr:metalloregulator ArsR/SmtB family transcription factor [Burkholderiaceae bacterium]